MLRRFNKDITYSTINILLSVIDDITYTIHDIKKGVV